MFDFTVLLAYLTGCAVIILIPRHTQALVISNCIGYGKKAGITTAVGLIIATIFHSVVAVLGLSAILATSALAFSVVKFFGAAYLVLLLLSAKVSLQLDSKKPNKHRKHLPGHLLHAY